MPRKRHPGRPDTFHLAWQSGVLLLALVLFSVVEPAEWLVCPFRRLSGWPCPLCGMTHALCAMGHGEVRRALEWNAAGVVVYGMIAGGFGVSVLEWCGGGRPRWLPSQGRAFGGLLVVLAACWVWRLAGLAA